MSVSGIHGQLLEVTVVGCNRLKNTELFSRQDPYVCLEYGSNKHRTTTCTDGGKTPKFQEKFVFPLIEGLREINVLVWNSNTITTDDFIGSGKVQLQKVLSQGYDDNAWQIQSKTGRAAGEVRLILHYSNANKPASSHAHSSSHYGATTGPPHVPPYSSHPQAPPPTSSYASPAFGAYPSSYGTPPYPASSPYPSYPPQPSGYPPSNHASYPQSPFPPTPYHSDYPSAPYPPNPAYPPPPHASPFYPPGSAYPGTYPSRPY